MCLNMHDVTDPSKWIRVIRNMINTFIDYFWLIQQIFDVQLLQMSKLDKFKLQESFCQPPFKINKFFAATYLKKWHLFDLFTRSVYYENPVTTPQEVFDIYVQSLVGITKIDNISRDVVSYVRKLHNQIVVWFLIVYCVLAWIFVSIQSDIFVLKDLTASAMSEKPFGIPCLTIRRGRAAVSIKIRLLCHWR